MSKKSEESNGIGCLFIILLFIICGLCDRIDDLEERVAIEHNHYYLEIRDEDTTKVYYIK